MEKEEKTIATAIALLGDTEESISVKLRAMGIKGKERSSCDCPIANYLRASGIPYVWVYASNIYSTQWGVGDAIKEKVMNSKALRNWIINFDVGMHSEFLEE